MTDRQPPLRAPHLADVARWHPVDGTPAEEVVTGRSAGATTRTCDPTASGRPEGD